MTIKFRLAASAAPRIINNLGCEGLVKVVGKFLGDLRVDQAFEPINDAVAKPSLVELFRGGSAKVVVIPPLFFKPPLMIATDIL